MKDTSFFEDDTNDILRLELETSSALYQKLYNGGSYKLFVELENDIPCTAVECKVDTLRVVKVDSVFYEYVEHPCVQMSFYNNGKQIMGYSNNRRATMCANSELTHAREACCREDRASEVRNAEMKSGVTYRYEGERMKWSTAQSRCAAYGRDLCVYEHIDVIPDNSSKRKGYHWTNKDCNINVKVNSVGYIAIVHEAMSTYKDTITWLVNEENTLNCEFIKSDLNGVY